jgi:hypothetical protein
VPAHDRSTIEGKIRDVRQAAQGEDLAAIRRLTEELQQASYAMSQQIGAQGQPGPEHGQRDGGAARPEGKGGAGEDVVEGEFREA